MALGYFRSNLIISIPYILSRDIYSVHADTPFARYARNILLLAVKGISDNV